MNPIDYSGAFAPESPAQAMIAGFKDGVGIRGVEDQRAQAQRAMEQQRQMQADLADLSQNMTPEKIGRISIKYPQLSEHFKRSYDMLAPEIQQGKLKTSIPVYAAMNAGRGDLASKMLRDHAAAMTNSGQEDEARGTIAMADLIEQHPETAKFTIGMTLASAMGPEKWAANLATLGAEARADELQGPALSKAESDAAKAGADASVAQDTAGIKVEQAKEDVLSAQAKREIDRLNIEIDQANSETKRGQLVLERDKLIAEQGLKAVERGEGAQAQIDSAQIALDNIRSLRAHPLIKDDNKWTGVGTIIGKMLGNVPGTGNMDFRAQLESLKSQVFLPAVQQVKGMGALSNAEGEKLTAAVAALNADMSEPALKTALGVVDLYMTKGLQKGLANKAVPVLGGGFVINHPTFGPVREGDVNRLMKQFPGSTREQVLQYLKNPGAK